MPNRIDQVVPSFASRDAIGVHMMHLQELLRDMGFLSDIWCIGAFEDVRPRCHLLDELDTSERSGSVWIYHLSNGSPAAEIVSSRPEPVLVDYHNITPGELFDPWVDWAVESAHEARRQMSKLASKAAFSFADSAFNERELIENGYSPTVVIPPLFDPSVHAGRPDPATMQRLESEKGNGGADWLFVGRVAPPKGQHDLIKAFACYRRLYDPQARLRLVGSWMGEQYPWALTRYANRLGLGASVDLAGPVSQAELAAYYSAADVFVSASDHEGFCIPVVEAMSFGVPVVSHAAGAVPETAGGAAIILEDKSALETAAAVARLMRDDRLRSALVREGRARAALFSLERTRRRWADGIVRAVSALPDSQPKVAGL